MVRPQELWHWVRSRGCRPRPTCRKVSLGVETLEGRSLMACTASTLCTAEVEALLNAASAATPSKDAIIAVVDRGGHILGVRVEDDVTLAGDTLVFAIDGAVAKARTAAFFANNQAPLTSRTVQFISQTTMTEREIRSNPNVMDPNSTDRGPGFVAEVGINGHFPPGVRFTPQVDLFAIEHTNRDSIVHPGLDHIRGTADDIVMPSRFNVDPAFIPPGQGIDPPESYGFVSGLLTRAQARGIGTLPGGIPIYKDANGDGVKRPDPLVGGIGVFIPGPEGFATYEQGLDPGRCSVAPGSQGVNAPCVLESEFIAAFPLLTGSLDVAPELGVTCLKCRLDLVGITLDTVGPLGSKGFKTLVQFGSDLRKQSPSLLNGTDQVIGGGGTLADGVPVPEGWLVTPHAGGALSAADVESIINQGIAEANRVRAAIRLPISQTTRMVLSVTDNDGNVLGLYRMPDATFFSIDVATAKARNVSYYASAGIRDIDRVDDNEDGIPDASVPVGTAFTNRTFRFLGLPFFPEGIQGTESGPFSILRDGGTDPRTARTVGGALPASLFQSVVGYDAFNPGTNFHSDHSYGPGDPRIPNQNGIVFFPGSTPVYKAGVLVGGFGVSGDGVDQDDVVTSGGSQGFLPPVGIRADQVKVRDIRLPFMKFLRNPHGR